MTRRQRWGVFVTVAVLLNWPCGQALAWGSLTHQWICSKVADEFRTEYFEWAGAYPDLGMLNEQLADHLHSPEPKRGVDPLTGVPYEDSVNFARLWQHKLELSPDPDPVVQQKARDIADGWGCHIAGDWVAHSWLPLVIDEDPSGSTGNTLHAAAEFEVDAYIACVKGYLPEAPLRLRIDPDELRGLVISHALADYATTAEGAERWPAFRERWETRPVFDAALGLRAYIFFPGWLQVENALLRRTRHAITLAGLEGLKRFGESVQPMLDKSCSLCAQWLAAPSAKGMPDIAGVEELYDPSLPPPPAPSTVPAPPGPVTPESVAELFQVLAGEAANLGLLDLDYLETSEPGVYEFTAAVPDEDAFAQFVATRLSELASPAAAAAFDENGPTNETDLTEGARTLAKVFDRIVNHGTVDLETVADVVPPYVASVTPEPGGPVRNLRPRVAGTVVDPYPSAGVDAGSLKVYVDGLPLDVSLSESGTFGTVLTSDLSQGYHTVEVAVADVLGQESQSSWPFTVALDLEWLPPVSLSRNNPWRVGQTVPVKFTLRDDEGNFGVDQGVRLVVFDPLDGSGTRRAVFDVGEGPGSLRIDLAEEQYVANVSLKDLGWVTPGAPVAVRVEAGGLVLGELTLETR